MPNMLWTIGTFHSAIFVCVSGNLPGNDANPMNITLPSTDLPATAANVIIPLNITNTSFIFGEFIPGLVALITANLYQDSFIFGELQLI